MECNAFINIVYHRDILSKLKMIYLELMFHKMILKKFCMQKYKNWIFQSVLSLLLIVLKNGRLKN